MAPVPAVISDAQIKEHDDFETSALSLNFSEFENALNQLKIDISHEDIRELFKKSKTPKQSVLEHFKWAEERKVLAIKERKEEIAHTGKGNFSSAEFKRLDPDDFKHTERREFCSAEISLAKICHGAHLKQLEHDITPIGSHYLLVHFDVPVLHEDTHSVRIHGLVNKVMMMMIMMIVMMMMIMVVMMMVVMMIIIMVMMMIVMMMKINNHIYIYICILNISYIYTKEMTLTMDAIRQRPKVVQQVLMECAGNGRLHMKNRLWVHVPWGPDAFGCSQWGGVSLRDLLLEVGICV
jgi:ABC-type multidrug transport system fused ATPase/permease subunit